MMDTPIYDFVKTYSESRNIRLHMPGHKGVPFLGPEDRDITEIDGADNLYTPDGIIKASENNASALFECRTYYSTEGSSLCIRAMLCLALGAKCSAGIRPVVLAARNAHKTFITAAALLDFDVHWIYPGAQDSYHSITLTPAMVEQGLQSSTVLPSAVYITSPDYLGKIADIRAIAEVCHRYDVPLLIDNAHGAYLRFLPESLHPMDLGADMCCDSAHKTLPVLTGGAYLHVGGRFAGLGAQTVKNALSLFGSTSPSYLILQSLDLANPYMETLPDRLSAMLPDIYSLKSELSSHGFTLCGQEPLKLTLSMAGYGYTGDEAADILRSQGIVCEFHDRDFLVFMLTPQNDTADLEALKKALLSLPKKEKRVPPTFSFSAPKQAISIREAYFQPSEVLPVNECAGRILALPNVGCPPAVPIVMCGELIDDDAIRLFHYYNMEFCTVVRESDYS